MSLLSEDPDNARVHPERNLQAIKDSLNLYGQVKPLVVRKETMTIVAGNGTFRAAREMGWTKLAANVISMSVVDAAGFGMADNRSAELARWDLEVVSRIIQLQEEAGHPTVGWTTQELIAARISEGIPPEDFPEVDENIEIEHQCPKCGYRFSGGEVKEKASMTVVDGEEIPF
jgi:ParB-like chromosome segregation protein Spo0J